eukprot:79420_1
MCFFFVQSVKSKDTMAIQATTYAWVDLTIALISLTVYAPTALYHYIRFKQLDNLIVIQKRYPCLTFHLCKYVLIYLVIAVPLFAMMRRETWMLLFGQQTVLLHNILWRVLHVIFPLCMYGIMTLTALRCWLMFYDLNWIMADKNSIWKYHLNPALIKSDFFLQHKDTLGSQPYCFKILLFVYFPVSIIMITAFQLTFSQDGYIYAHVANSVFLLVPSIFITVLWFKTKHCLNDNFFIRSEFKLISIIIATMICFYFIPMMMMVVTPTWFILWDAIAIFSSATTFFFISIASTYWVRGKVNRNIKHYLSNHKGNNSSNFKFDVGFLYGEFGEDLLRKQRVSERISSTVLSASTPNSLTTQLHQHQASNGTGSTAKDIQLYHMMTNYDAFELFILHLSKEFSTELMLSLITIIQWKHMLCAHYHEKVIQDASYVALKSDKCRECILSHGIPMNDIAIKHFGEFASTKANKTVDEFMQSAKQSAVDIYTKYIKVGAPLEVNISFELRASLAGICNTLSGNSAIDINDLFGMFDSVGEEQYRLMSFSFVRFKKTPDWIKVADVFSKHELIASPCDA